MYREIFNRPIEIGSIICFPTYRSFMSIGIVYSKSVDPNTQGYGTSWSPYNLKIYKVTRRYGTLIKRRVAVGHKDVVVMSLTQFLTESIFYDDKKLYMQNLVNELINGKRV